MLGCANSGWTVLLFMCMSLLLHLIRQGCCPTICCFTCCRECYDAMTEAQRNRLEAYNRSNLQVCAIPQPWTVHSAAVDPLLSAAAAQLCTCRSCRCRSDSTRTVNSSRLLQFQLSTAEGKDTMGRESPPIPSLLSALPQRLWALRQVAIHKNINVHAPQDCCGCA